MEVGEVIVGAATRIGLHVDGLSVTTRQGELVGGVRAVFVHAAVTVDAREDGLLTHIAHGESGEIGQVSRGGSGVVLKGHPPADGIVAGGGVVGDLHHDSEGIAEQTGHAGHVALGHGVREREILGKAVIALAAVGVGHREVGEGFFENVGHGGTPFVGSFASIVGFLYRNGPRVMGDDQVLDGLADLKAGGACLGAPRGDHMPHPIGMGVNGGAGVDKKGGVSVQACVHVGVIGGDVAKVVLFHDGENAVDLLGGQFHGGFCVQDAAPPDCLNRFPCFPFKFPIADLYGVDGSPLLIVQVAASIVVDADIVHVPAGGGKTLVFCQGIVLGTGLVEGFRIDTADHLAHVGGGILTGMIVLGVTADP